jgi:RNA polymerase sigma-70 factor (ECF subfamily)
MSVGTIEPGAGAGGSAKLIHAIPWTGRSGELIQSVARTRDPAAFTALFQTYRPKLVSYFLRYGVDEPAAEELTQDALLAVWRKADQFDPARAQAASWIFAIARNLRIDRLRRQRVRPVDGAPQAADADDVQAVRGGGDGWSEPADAQLELHEALLSLSQGDAEVLGMAFVEGWTHRQMAERLHLPLGTVKSRVRRAACRLRSLLDGEV